jgi:hypothetical protein
MIIGTALEAWLADPDARSSTVAGLEATRQELRAQPGYAKLECAADAEASGDGIRLLALARGFMADDRAVRQSMAILLDGANRDPFFRPPVRSTLSEIQAGLLLFDRPQLSVYLAIASPVPIAEKRLLRTERASIAFTGRRSIYRFLKAGGSVLSIWEAPAIDQGFSAATSGRCRFVERRVLRDGEFLELDGSRHGFVIDYAEAEIVYLHASTPAGGAPLMVEYDSDTMEFAGASSSDEVSSRVQLMLTLLRAMERTDAAEIFAEIAAGRHFFDRWYAMREFLALDAEKALPHLREMAIVDPHPEVRAAACQTLARFFSEDVEEPATCLA